MTLGRHDLLWDSLRFAEAPGLRSYLIRDLVRYGVNPTILIGRLRSPCDASLKRAILLALGGYPPGLIPPEELRSLTTRLLEDYQSDPDPGLHAAIEWLLRHRWGCGPVHDGSVNVIPGGMVSPGGPRWFVNGQGQTMVLVSGPVEFTMGSPPDEDGHDPDEVWHRVRIGRSFAVASCEVTVGQYGRFLDRTPDLKALFQGRRGGQLRQYSPSPDCPMVAVDWYDAARYCNWLSQQEGIPEDQWCYPKEIGPGMSMPPGYLSRSGYRLPTEAEWEYACRAGTVSPRCFGAADDVLPGYAWTLPKAGSRTHPVGRLKPNDLGLFDMLGNAHEWVQDPFREYPSSPEDRAVDDVEIGTKYEDRFDGVLRGGSFEHPLADIRSAHRYSVALRSMRRAITTFGFRVAKTCH